jgi:hypothetical protein
MTPDPFKNFYLDLLKYHMDVFFRRTAPMEPEGPARAEPSGRSLLKSIQETAKAALGGTKGPGLGLYIPEGRPAGLGLEPSLALPRWLIQQAKSGCLGTPENIEACLWDILADPLALRRAADHIMIDEEALLLRGSDALHKTEWMGKRLRVLKDNAWDQRLSAMHSAIKLSDGLLNRHMRSLPGQAQFAFEMLGTISLMNFGTDMVYRNTHEALKNKYRKDTILKAFEQSFLGHKKKDGFEWALLTVGQVPKLFAVRDLLREAGCDPEALAAGQTGIDIDTLTLTILTLFDQGTETGGPWSRFRLAKQPTQELINSLGAIYWLKKTLEDVKLRQSQAHGLPPVREVSAVGANAAMFKTAMAQKAMVSLSLVSNQHERSPCLGLITRVRERTMTVGAAPACSGWAGKRAHVAFSTASDKGRKTYFHFESIVDSVSQSSAGDWEVSLALPRAVVVNRRASPRVGLGAKSMPVLAVAPFQAKDQTSGDKAAKPAPPLACLPDRADVFRAVDVSATGVSFQVRLSGPDELTRLLAHGREVVLHMGLAWGDGQVLNLVLKSVVRSVTLAPDATRYLGLQFLAQGQVTANGAVRWQPLGETGVWAISDWIFKQARAELNKNKPPTRVG